MVKLLDLRESEERIVRSVVKSPTGNITVFEPTIDDVNTVLSIQREKGMRNEDTVEFSDVVVLKELFPLFTDIEIDELTDEEVQSILDKPSIQLMAVQNIVSQIVAEINTIFIERMKTELIQAKSAVTQLSLMTMIPQIAKEEAERTGDERTLKNLEVMQRPIKDEE